VTTARYRDDFCGHRVADIPDGTVHPRIGAARAAVVFATAASAPKARR